MKMRWWLWLAVLLGVVVLALAVVALNGDVFLVTEELTSEGPISETDAGPVTEQTVFFYDAAGTEMATATVEVWPDSELQRVVVNIAHPEEVRLDSLTLIFNQGRGAAPLALLTPGGYPWPPLEYHFTQDARGVVLRVPDLGVQGRGSVTLEFVMGRALFAPLPEALEVEVSLALHRESWLTLTQHVGEATIPVVFGEPSARRIGPGS